ncbi:MAG: sel1 repeat family protein [Burkholderiaceae bacterium]|nr:sel1 repeat family protein [Burkholderiaceae bacterium]
MKQSTDIKLRGIGCILLIAAGVIGNAMTNPYYKLPRNQELPLFHPHTDKFDCIPEVAAVPPVDAEAHAWFLEARKLEDFHLFPEERDYPKIVRLTRQAAERRHWQSMINLASFYIEGLDPKHGVGDAVMLVEEAMQLGIPAAYDRMGVYHMNGTGVTPDATRAYAFLQKAAQMGNPDALAYLAERLYTNRDEGDRWSNIPIATKMMECAFSQGNTGVAFLLHDSYRVPREAEGRIVESPTPETKDKALRLLHEAVKRGGELSASELYLQFDGPSDKYHMLPTAVDKARAKRYVKLSDALGFDHRRRFPNLDKMLPLPPADLPPWDGTRDSLLNAVMGVTFSPALPPETSRPPGDRHFVDPAYRLRKIAETTNAPRAPFGGYWQPFVNGLEVKDRPPALYDKNESFPTIYVPGEYASKPLTGITWVYHITVRNTRYEVDPIALPGLTRQVPRPATPVTHRSHEACTVGGIWQPWVSEAHPLQAIVNQPWRQVFLLKGQSFPQPKQDWLLDLDAKEVTWHLMEQTEPGMITKGGG